MGVWKRSLRGVRAVDEVRAKGAASMPSQERDSQQACS